MTRLQMGSSRPTSNTYPLVADEVWIATALLHREHAKRRDFTVSEIVERARREALGPGLRPGVNVHAYMHCVANREPNPGRYRMLYATGSNTRRLYRPGDQADPRRRGKITPRRDQIPERYRSLLDWYERKYCRAASPAPEPDPILALRGSGAEIWRDEHADQYVRRLREGWE